MAEALVNDRQLNTENKLVSVYVKERKAYYYKELEKNFNPKNNKLSNDVSKRIISLLQQYGILRRAVKQDDDMPSILDGDVVVYEDAESLKDDFKYEIPFVGIIVADGLVIKCYPKYLPDSDTNLGPKDEFKEVMEVLRKYNETRTKNREKNRLNIYDDGGSYNRLSLLLDILNDYYENGIYTNSMNITEINGPGEILWDRTINGTLALIYDGSPYYVNLTTRRHVKKEHDYFTRLHELIITEVSTELEKADLLDVFGIPKINLSEENFGVFGDVSEILYNIDKEFNRQFNSRKRYVLGLLRAYLKSDKSLTDGDGFSLFGTFSFEYVWQEVCSCIFDNKIEVPFENLTLPVPFDDMCIKDSYDDEKAPTDLMKLIERPFWSITERRSEYSLQPDIISIKGDEFVIFDAKYYTPKLKQGAKPENQPGVESVVKQYLYQLAYREFLSVHKFSRVWNCFLIPSDKDEDEYMGYVSMDKLFSLFQESHPELQLKNIKVIFLSARKCYRKYLSGEHVNIDNLPLD